MRANELVHLFGRRSANTIRARGEVAASKAGYTTASTGYVVIDRKSLARRGRSIHVVLLEQDGADEPDDGVVVGEDAHHLGSALDLTVDPLDRVGNRYEDGGANVRLQRFELRCMVRPSGTEAPGARRCGQADAQSELRARVSSWPPLRLARLRRERGSVGVVSPAAPDREPMEEHQ